MDAWRYAVMSGLSVAKVKPASQPSAQPRVGDVIAGY
jgi:hypothetical protein